MKNHQGFWVRCTAVSGPGDRPTAAPEPRVIVSHHGAPRHTSLCHRHSIESDYSPSERGICTVRVGLASGLQYARTPRIHWRPSKSQTPSVPMPSRVPVPRWHISGITRSIGFLGHPSRQGIRPGRLLPSLREPLTGYSVPCVHFPWP